MSFDKQFILQNKKLITLSLVCFISLLFIVSSIWSLSSFLYTRPAPSTPLKDTKGKTHTENTSSNPHYPLFGEYIPKEGDKGSIPKTILNLKLIGVLKASSKSQSQAIIQIVGGDEKVYLLNDTLPGDAKIVRIFKNSILLLREGKLERLSITKPKLKSSAPQKPLEFKP